MMKSYIEEGTIGDEEGREGFKIGVGYDFIVF